MATGPVTPLVVTVCVRQDTLARNAACRLCASRAILALRALCTTHVATTACATLERASVRASWAILGRHATLPPRSAAVPARLL